MEITYKHKTNIKLITAVAIDTNTCYNFGLIFKIMILTDKAKNDFINWCKKQKDLSIGLQIPNTMGGVVFSLNSNVEILPIRIQNHLIVEWLESLGKYSDTHADFKFTLLSTLSHEVNSLLSYQEKLEYAIKIANNVYNQSCSKAEL